MVRTTCLLIITLVLSPIGKTASAQEAEKNEHQKIEFSGGTVTQYIEFLNSKFDQINTVVDTPAADFTLPSIRLTTDAEGAVMVLDGLSFKSRKLCVKREEEFYLNSSVPMAQIVLDGAPDVVKVVNVKSLLNTISQDDLLDVAKFGLETQGTVGQVQLRLHSKTGILFVKGESSEVLLVLQTIEQLTVGARDMPAKGPTTRPADPGVRSTGKNSQGR